MSFDYPEDQVRPLRKPFRARMLSEGRSTVLFVHYSATTEDKRVILTAAVLRRHAFQKGDFPSDFPETNLRAYKISTGLPGLLFARFTILDYFLQLHSTVT